MELNADCVRDVLISLEGCEFHEHMTLDMLVDKLPDYSEEQLWYTCLKLEEGGYLDLMTVQMLRMTMPAIKQINSITFAGHEFLNTVRENKNWKKAKDIAKAAGAFSIKALGDIAKEVAAAAIKAALQSPP
ncbi:conserved hypothetical protein [uncultured Eubacteriales bacterium]|uniref:DUF2513 domain-containing protein n=1 Tax=uncultured Eubacteriales bacterium TaxID=172733 RepID=A0A212J3K1_9FIRM|nr:conserved hypothetical protein [uncultured Eubacteriales bacterium]